MIGKEIQKTKENSCGDKKCPIHGSIVVRGRMFKGIVVAKDMHRTATVEWSYKVFIPKFERSETRRTRVHVHNPVCISAEIGDMVRIAQTRPISKTKNFAIVENLGKAKGFGEKLAAEEESKEIIQKKERKKIAVEKPAAKSVKESAETKEEQ